MLTRSRQVFAALTIAVGLAACSDTPSEPGLAPAAARAARQAGHAPQVIPGRYVVLFNEDVRDAPGLARRLADAHGGKLHHSYQHALKGFAASLPPGAAEALRRDPNVAYVQQDHLVTLTQTSQSGATWGLDRVDQRDLPLYGVYTYTRTGAGVTVYVIDSGIETSHGDFGGRARVGYDALGGSGQDCRGHGTHVAGAIGGTTWGVAKSASLVAVRVFGCSGGSPASTVIAGIDWVRANHQKPAVANLSLGGGADTLLDTALRSLVAAGVTAVVSAGNDNADACLYSPARVADALTVGATNWTDARTVFSNYGQCVDLYAPGKSITSAWLGGGTSSIDGTSMAAPHVAGAAALYLQGHPTASPATVNGVIVSNATSGRLSGMGPASANLLLYTRFGSRVGVNRLYNGWDHLYALDANEGVGVGYGLETFSYFFLQAASGDRALYRCFEPGGGHHFLSVAADCEGFQTEGVLGYVAATQLPGTIPLYRTHDPNSGDHLYTTSAAERDHVVGLGWQYEGVTGYVYSGP